MITPSLERVDIPLGDIEHHVHVLTQLYRLPEGSEVVDGRALRTYRKQLEQGYYMRLVWPPEARRVDVAEWHDHAQEILNWHRLGVV